MAAVAFPLSVTSPSSTRWWRRPGRVAVVALAVIALVTGVLYRQAAASTEGYRTALVSNEDVTSVLTSVGTIEPVSQAAVAFPSSGTVATVDIAAGATVTAGQVLATMDTTSLVATLHDKQAALASAQLALTKALAGESTSSSGSSGSSPSGSSVAAASSSSSSSASATSSGSATAATTATIATAAAVGSPPSTTPSSDTELSQAQQAVLTAQHQVDVALAAAAQALASSTQICAAVQVDDPASLSACEAALQAVSDAQQQVSTAQAALAAASNALDALLAQRAADQSGTTTTTATPSAPTGASNGSSTGAASSGGSTTTSSSPSAADLVSYQKAVDAAGAEVSVADQAVAQATIVSPIAGTVGAVNLAVGDSVTAASTSATVVVVGAGGFEVTTTVSVTDVPQLKVGQKASVVADGTGETLEGTVVSISAAPVSSSSSTSSAATYLVVLALSAPTQDLGNGSTGSVAIQTAAVTGAIAVPTSAVTTTATGHTATVLDGSTTTVTSVEVGVVGDQWTQITGGVSLGRTVVVADLDAALPGSATSTSANAQRRGTGTGPPAGFTGGPPSGAGPSGG